MPLIFLDVLCGHVNKIKEKVVNTDRIITIEQEHEADSANGTPAVSRITLEGGRTVDVLGTIVEVHNQIEYQADEANRRRAEEMASVYVGNATKLMQEAARPPYPPGTVDVPLDNPAAVPAPAATPTT